MRSRLALLSFALLMTAVSCQKSPGPPSPDHPRLSPNVRLQDVTFHSSSLQRDMPYRVILPSNIAPRQKLPVVYLLHGGGGGYRDWSNYSDVAQFAERGLILVMPEGNSSYYMNAAERRRDRYEDYITKDLISDVESRFPVVSGGARRAIVGISMGGFGALTLTLKHPGEFGFAAGMSSALDVPSRPFSIKRIGQYREHAAIFGPWASQARRENDPYVLANSVTPNKMPYIFLTCGEQEGLLPANTRFAALLQKRGFKFEFHAGPGGHDWNQWNGRLSSVFEKLLQHVSQAN